MTRADAIALAESIVAARVGELARQLRADGPAHGLGPEDIEAAISEALDLADQERARLRTEIVRILDGLDRETSEGSR